ncbi:hypothetical protein BDN72DRAFT_682159 [Pluteus cervinus]|uniref:Uncharacterized protein n=1 Tax=Pluteus cervinus TaxID=181527 RepID=A0ACD3ARM9_9AGAR|nr:hypothetical protein BDN72DRAFT_682159 [Pluteus cervinus]
MPSSSLHLLTLPLEILITILTYLPSSSLYQCLLTCSHLHTLILSSTPLLLIFECSLADVEFNPSYNPNSSYQCNPSHNSNALRGSQEKLKYLREREKAWREFTPKWKKKVKVEHRPTGIYDLTPNVYFLGRQVGSNNGDFGGGGDSGSDAIMCLTFPERKEELEAELATEAEVEVEAEADRLGCDEKEGGDNDVKGKRKAGQWKEIGLEGKRIKDFGTALEEHDLIALVVSEPIENQTDSYMLQIALLRYSTGKYHDEAKSPIIPIHEYSLSQGPPSVSIEIVGENLGLIVMYPHIWEDDDDIFVIYDWKLGTTKTPTPIDITNIGLCFLTETLLVHPNRRDESLDIYHIPYSFENQPVTLVLQLCFPTISRDYLISTLSCRGEPNPIGDSSLTTDLAGLSSCITGTTSSPISTTSTPSSSSTPGTAPGIGTSTPGTAPGIGTSTSHTTTGTGKYAHPSRPFTSSPSTALIIFQMDLHPQTDGLTPQSFEFVIHRNTLLGEVRKYVKEREDEEARRKENRRRRKEKWRVTEVVEEEGLGGDVDVDVEGDKDGMDGMGEAENNNEESERRSIRERLKEVQNEYVPEAFVSFG